MSLQFSARLAARGFDVTMEVADGERVAVLGHNGSGKSTLLGILAGILRPDSGFAAVDGKVLFDIGRGRSRWLAPHMRDISLLGQAALLFPHMSVQSNVAFGPRMKGMPKGEAASRAEHWLAEVGIPELSGRKPGQLSGGQAQRVAIARALAADPGLLLLDEPMAALDVAVAPVLRRVLRRVLTGQPTIMVTHDLLDATLLSERIVVLEQGRVVESGTTTEVLEHPRTRFTAGLAGLNLVRGRYVSGGVEDQQGFRIEGSQGEDEELSDGDAAAAIFAPNAVSIFAQSPVGSPRNNLPVVITEIEPLYQLVRVRGDDRHGHSLAADVTPRAVADLDLYPGKGVVYSVKATAVSLYPI